MAQGFSELGLLTHLLGAGGAAAGSEGEGLCGAEMQQLCRGGSLGLTLHSWVITEHAVRGFNPED